MHMMNTGNFRIRSHFNNIKTGRCVALKSDMQNNSLILLTIKLKRFYKKYFYILVNVGSVNFHFSLDSLYFQ